MASVSGIARMVIASGGGNVLDDYYRFYNDGKWVVEVVRKISSTLSTMERGMAEHLPSMPKLEECIGYLDDIKGDDMGVVPFVKELKVKFKGIKDKYSEWDGCDASERERLSGEHKALVMALREYVSAYADSCVNAVRNRYVEDEENVRNLLDVIHSAGNAVMNSGTANAKNHVSKV